MSDSDQGTSRRTETARRLFSDFFAEHANGLDNDKATTALAELVQAVHTLDKPGKLTITLTVAPADDGVTIVPKVACTMPPEPLTGKYYFVGDDGLPTRRDPNQPALFDDDA